METAKYRTDVDGLRALAIVPVVAFHYLSRSWFHGGFVGVDIFFVISGYLISRIIFDEIGRGSYSIVSFYDRRIRRIFPALFAMYAGCIAAALWLSFPSEARVIGRSIGSSALFVSNIFFFENTAAYFNQQLQQNPLLHTWSLSVEEQFYILFPLLVFGVRRFPRKLQLSVFGGIGIISFLASAWMSRAAPAEAFYLVPFRAWELMIGAVLSIAELPAPRKWVAEACGAAGVLAILGSIRLLSPASVFPAPGALAACLGTAAVIYSGSGAETVVSRLLSVKPVRFVGLISYSLYLWHWPVIAFGVPQFGHDLWTKLALMLLSVVLASLSWRFVERPFRGRKWRSSPRKSLATGGVLMAGVLLMCAGLAPANRLVNPSPPEAERILAFQSVDYMPSMREGTCFMTSRTTDLPGINERQCLALEAGRPNVLIFGDSHAAHLWAGLHKTYPNVHFLQATASGCVPLLDSPGAGRCTKTRAFIFNDYLPHHKVDAIIIAMRWSSSPDGRLVATAQRLSRYAPVVIVGPVAEYDPSLPRILALAARRHEDLTKAAAAHRTANARLFDAQIRSLQLPAGVRYLSAYKVTAEGICPLLSARGEPIQFDYGHLTPSGSACMARQIGPLLPPNVIASR